MFFYKIKTQGHPEYLDKVISAKSSSCNTHNANHIKHMAKLIFLNIQSFLIGLSNGTGWTLLFVIENPAIFATPWD